MKLSTLKSVFFRLLVSLARGLALGVACIYVILYFWQERLLFFPQPNDPQWAHARQASRVEITSGGEVLEGWWIENRNASTSATILYFGGNGEAILGTSYDLEVLDASRVLVVNYRGYGASSGTPSQEALYADALAIYDHAIARGAKPESIVVMGRSLGSGVATMLAASRPVRAAILVTPYDSIEAVASKRYFFVPVHLMIRHPFPSVDWATSTRTPVLMLAAQRDTVVPVQHARTLFEAWSGPKRLEVLTGAGHNSIHRQPSYYPLINTFLQETAQD